MKGTKWELRTKSTTPRWAHDNRRQQVGLPSAATARPSLLAVLVGRNEPPDHSKCREKAAR